MSRLRCACGSSGANSADRNNGPARADVRALACGRRGRLPTVHRDPAPTHARSRGRTRAAGRVRPRGSRDRRRENLRGALQFRIDGEPVRQPVRLRRQQVAGNGHVRCMRVQPGCVATRVRDLHEPLRAERFVVRIRRQRRRVDDIVRPHGGRWPATAGPHDMARGARTVPPDGRACGRSAAARRTRVRRAATRPACRSRRRRRRAACARYRDRGRSWRRSARAGDARSIANVAASRHAACARARIAPYRRLP